MPWYELAKVVHFFGLIALFGFFVVRVRVAPRLLAATTAEEARTWLGVLEATRGMFDGGAGMFLLSGLAMAGLRWRGPYPFVAVGLATLLVMWVLWLVVGSRHLRAIRAALGEGGGAISPDAARVIRDPRAWSVMAALNGAAPGVLIEMTLKLGWVGAIAVVLVPAVIGAVVGARVPTARSTTERR